MYLFAGSVPKRTTVTAELLYPSSAGPAAQVLSLKLRCDQFVPWFDPLSKYFQTEPAAMKVVDVVGRLVVKPTRSETRRLPTLSVATALKTCGPRGGFGQFQL